MRALSWLAICWAISSLPQLRRYSMMPVARKLWQPIFVSMPLPRCWTVFYTTVTSSSADHGAGGLKRACRAPSQRGRTTPSRALSLTGFEVTTEVSVNRFRFMVNSARFFCGETHSGSGPFYGGKVWNIRALNPSHRNHPIRPLSIYADSPVVRCGRFSDFRVVHDAANLIDPRTDLDVTMNVRVSELMKRGNRNFASRTSQIMIFICDKVRRNETRRVIRIQYLDSNLVDDVKQEHPGQQFASS